MDSVDGNGMSAIKHDAENKGAHPRDHVHPRFHFLRHAHQDWRVWVAIVLMLAMILVYVFTMDLSWRPRNPTGQRMPAVSGP